MKDTDLAWFAGIIDGEGSITAQVMLRNGSETDLRITPLLSVSNTDEGIIERCAEVLRAAGIDFDLYERVVVAKPAFKSVKKCWSLRVCAGKRLKILLPMLIPYLASVKRAYAERLLQYIELRDADLIERNAKGQVKRKCYSREQIELIASIRTHPKARSLAAMYAASNVMQ